jgi:hypothetical protein
LNGLTAGLSGINNTLSSQILSKLNAMDNFAKTAWSATRADKVLNLINTALILHNAVMLSNSVYYTVTEIIDNVFTTFNITDHEGNDIDVSSWIGNKLQTIIQSIIGVGAYENLSTTLKRGNRIYQASANLLMNVRSIWDSTRNIAELTSENVSIIGNALRKCGVVRENSYGWMPENVNATNGFIKKMQDIQDGLEILEEISSDTLNISQEFTEIDQNRTEFKTAVDNWNSDKNTTEDDNKTEATTFVEPTEEDTEKAE